MQDQHGRWLEVGDPVTVRGPSDGKRYLNGSHARVVSLGRVRVKVEVTEAAFGEDDGMVVSLLPADLEFGHNGIARNSGRLTEAIDELALASIRAAVDAGVEDDVITRDQGERLIKSWRQRRGA
jgi:hypothetical protein